MTTGTSGTIPTVNQELIDAIKDAKDFDNGDVYDEDTGKYLATIDLKAEGEVVETLPARVSIFMHGYWYIFSPIIRYKHEEKEDEKVEETKAS